MEPRMQKYRLSEEEMLSLIGRTDCAVLCTNGEDGYPYGTPVNVVLLDGRIYFHGRARGTRTSNILRDPRCCITFTEERGYHSEGSTACDTEALFRSVIVYGRASVVEDPGLKTRVLRALTDRLVPEKSDAPIAADRVGFTGVYEVTIERMTGKYRDPKPDGVTYRRRTLQLQRGWLISPGRLRSVIPCSRTCRSTR